MAEVYEMMMKLGLNNSALTGLIAVSERLTRIHRISEDITASFSRWGVVLGGAASILAGGAMLGGLERLMKGSAAYTDVLIRARATGKELRDMVDTGVLQKMAFDMSKRVPMKVEDLINIPTTLYSIVGKEEAVKLWEPFARYSMLQQGDAKFKGDPETPIRALVRAGELTGRFMDDKGAFDPEKAKEFLELMVKIKNATHGMVNEQTILAFAMRAGPTARNLTNQGFMTEAINMQAMGGHQAGVSLMSLWQQMAGGTMFARTAKGLEEIGLLGKDEWSQKGGRVILSDDASKRLTKLISKDPTDLIAAIVNAFEEKGITDPEERQRMLMRMLNRQTTQRMISEMVVNRKQQRAERERMEGGMGADELFDVQRAKSISNNLTAVASAWHNFTLAIAGPNGEQFISMLKTFASALNFLTDKVRGLDPSTITAIGYAIAGLGAVLIGGGIVAILAAIGPAGWLIGGLAALAVALADPRFQTWLTSNSLSDAINRLAASEWEHIMKGFNEIKDGITGLASSEWDSVVRGFNGITSGMAGLAALAWDSIAKGLDSVKTAISSFIDALMAKAASLSQSFGDWLKRPLIGPQKQSFEGEPDQPRLIPANFNPGERKQILQPIQMNLNLDGKTLAQAVSDILEDLYTHPTGPPQANGWDHFRPQGNFSDT